MGRAQGVQVFYFDEWVNILENMDAFYCFVSEKTIMTGMIGSGIAGLRTSDLTNGVIEVQNKRVMKRKKEGVLDIKGERLKTDVDRGGYLSLQTESSCFRRS